ncbi:MAG: HAD-IA family hydrolase [Gammaproteobacteria bacterium]|nr:HAD-IA family hydrolase [Gammaproteobacteria bacterium]
MKSIQAILFDLDGTLLDTAADLGAALNQLLLEEKLPVQSFEKIRPAAGMGTSGLLKLGFGVNASNSNYSRLRNRFLELYDQHLTEQTQLFPGVLEILQILDERKIPWGIVTNKPARFTDPLIRYLQFESRAHCVISGDTLPFHKPHPAQILHACELLTCPPENCIYVGDMQTDVIASRHANARAFTALYGYISPEENPRNWNADVYLEQPNDLLEWIE